MSPSVPAHAFTLRGGCFCNAITYTISIPELSLRPPKRTPPPHSDCPKSEETSQYSPLILFDHCNTCRRIAGAIVQAWFICPQAWITFSLLTSSTSSSSFSMDPNASIDGNRMERPTIEVVNPSAALLEQTHVRHFSSSKDVHRIFCGRCGTHLSYFYAGEKNPEKAKLCDIALGSLDRESLAMQGVQPRKHSWWGEGIGWVQKLLKSGEEGTVTG
jgi:hypothetical protein